MFSALPPIQPVDDLLGIHFSAFESGSPSWDNFSNPNFAFSHQEPDFFATQLVSYNLDSDNSNSNSEPFLSDRTQTSSMSDYFEPDFLAIEPALFHSGSYNSKANPEPVLSDPTHNWAHNFSSGSDHVEPDYLILATEPVLSNSCSENSNQELVHSKPTQKRASNQNSGSDDVASDQKGISVIDERKRRRMKSNRESAQRSRMRKQRHLEDLQNQANRLEGLNRELLNRLSFMTRHLHIVRTDNDRLRAESFLLSQKLWAVQQIMLFRELSINKQILP